jgi:hypothetical protein
VVKTKELHFQLWFCFIKDLARSEALIIYLL